MSPSNQPREIEIVPELVSRLIELFDPEKIVAVNISLILKDLTNIVFRDKKVRIEEFQLTRAKSSIPVYHPGAFPIGFAPIKTLKDLTTVTPIIVFANFTITKTDASKIKAKGIGELSIYWKKDKIVVKARNMWHIEEVMEISPRRQEKLRTKKLEKFIKELLIVFLVTLLAELATKALILS